MFVQDSGAVSITEFTQADEVVGEPWYDVAGSSCNRWNARDGQLGRSGGGSLFSRGGADVSARRGRINVDERGRGCEVVIGGAGVDNCSVVVIKRWATGYGSSG